MTLIAETGSAASTFRSKERSFHLPWHSCRRWPDTSRQIHFWNWFFSTIFHNWFLQRLHFISLHPGSSFAWQDAAFTTCRWKLVNIKIFARAFTLWRGHHASTAINIAKYIMDKYILVRCNSFQKKLCILRSQIRSAAIIQYLSQMKAFNAGTTRCQLWLQISKTMGQWELRCFLVFVFLVF